MIRGSVRQPITTEMLAPLMERHGGRWRIWPSAQGEYACATLRRGLSWVRPHGRHPVGAHGAYVRTLVTDSPDELAAAIAGEDENIAHLLAENVLTATAS